MEKYVRFHEFHLHKMVATVQMSSSGAMLSSLAWVVALFVVTSATTDYQCWNFKSTDTIRDLYLKNINSLRKAIAEGTAANNVGFCPAGKNIYKLQWDCLLEQEAQKAVETCSETATAPQGTSILIQKEATTCNAIPLFKQTVTKWWDVVRTQGLPDTAVFDKPGLENFAKLAHGKATRIGCAQKNCNGNLYMACVVYEEAPKQGQPIYELGTGCASDAECTTFAGSKCNKQQKLCVAGYIDRSATTSTTAATTTAAATTTTASTTAAGPTTSTVPPHQTRLCPSNAHILTDEIRNIFITLHNGHRSNLARGLVNNGNPQAYARQASKMIKLEYDCDAEKTAFEWAMQCEDRDSGRSGVSENRYTFPNMNLDMQTVARRASNRWWEEITKVGLSQVDNRFYTHLGVSHWARMAWDSTRYFGCGIYRCPTFINAVCHYKGGGVVGEQIYKMGPACNRCHLINARQCEQGLCLMS